MSTTKKGEIQSSHYAQINKIMGYEELYLYVGFQTLQIRGGSNNPHCKLP